MRLFSAVLIVLSVSVAAHADIPKPAPSPSVITFECSPENGDAFPTLKAAEFKTADGQHGIDVTVQESSSASSVTYKVYPEAQEFTALAKTMNMDSSVPVKGLIGRLEVGAANPAAIMLNFQFVVFGHSHKQRIWGTLASGGQVYEFLSCN